MDIFQIDGPVRLEGGVSISGSKNATLPIMAATILAPGKSAIKGAPRLSDIAMLASCCKPWAPLSKQAIPASC